MKKLIVKLIICCCVVVLLSAMIIFVTFWLLGDSFEDSYQKGLVYQTRALERSDPDTPKIVILGASFLPFGVRPALIRAKTGRPVYTLGINGGLGYSLLIDMIWNQIHRGDVVVVMWQDFQQDDVGMPLFFVTFGAEKDILYRYFRKHPYDMIASVGPACARTWVGKLGPFFKMIKRRTGVKVSDCYCASSFDPKTGDFIYKCETSLAEDVPINLVRHRVCDTRSYGIRRVNELKRHCDEMGAKLYLVFPPMLDEAVVSTPDELAARESALSSACEASFLGRLKDSFFSRDKVYNGQMHLNDKGAEIYTENLINGLRKVGAL